MEEIKKVNKRRAFNKTVGSGKYPKKINVEPMFIPDYRVCDRVLPKFDFEVLLKKTK